MLQANKKQAVVYIHLNKIVTVSDQDIPFAPSIQENTLERMATKPKWANVKANLCSRHQLAT